MDPALSLVTLKIRQLYDYLTLLLLDERRDINLGGVSLASTATAANRYCPLSECLYTQKQTKTI